jgi:hypothetical protein
MRRLTSLLAGVMGAFLTANGLYMLLNPVNWYFLIPGVTTTGPYNQHFIRDIGLTFVIVGMAYIIGSIKIDIRLLLWGAATLWLAGHAMFHLWEVATGLCSPSKLGTDFPGVFAPVLIGLGLTFWAYRERPLSS